MTKDEFKQDLIHFLSEWNNTEKKVLVHTSGSTGKPKPLWVEKEKMKASARLTCEFLHLQTGDSALLCMPLQYIAGKMVVVRSLVANLRLLLVAPCGHPLADLQEIPSFAAMIPMQVYNSLQVPEEREKLKQIRHLIIGGGAIDAKLAEELKSFPQAVWSTYGMTETLSHIALRRLNGAKASDWYTPFKEVSIRLSDEGTLCIHAPQVCAEELITNDIAELNDKGEFRIIGRKDNIINSGGIKIQIEEVEKRLKEVIPYPFMITSQPHPKFGEIVVLLVEETSQINNKKIADSPSEMNKFTFSLQNECTKNLPTYWIPKKIIVVSQLPMTQTGKPDRATARILAKNE